MSRVPSSDVPDTLLPVQFFTRTALSDTPEKRLIFAVLMDAIMQLQRGDASSVADAGGWIRDEIEGAPITFSDACEVLGLEAQGFGRALLSWHAQSGLVAGIRVPPITRAQQRVTPSGRLRVRVAR
jgi:hypothetical protein